MSFRLLYTIVSISLALSACSDTNRAKLNRVSKPDVANKDVDQATLKAATDSQKNAGNDFSGTGSSGAGNGDIKTTSDAGSQPGGPTGDQALSGGVPPADGATPGVTKNGETTAPVFTAVNAPDNAVVVPPPAAAPSSSEAPSAVAPSQATLDATTTTTATANATGPVSETPAAATATALAIEPSADTAKAEATRCAHPYQNTDTNWYPGLPVAPAKQPLFTDFENKAANGVRFTDGHPDNLLSVIVDRSNALPGFMQEESRNFSKRITSVKLHVDTRATGSVTARFEINPVEDRQASAQDKKKEKKIVVDLTGQIAEFKSVKRADVKLTQIIASAKGASKAHKAHYAGLLTCADVDQGCKNIVVRLDRINTNGKVVYAAFIVHRWGSGRLTLSPEDRRQYARYPNKNYSAFAELLANSLNNFCLNILKESAKPKRAHDIDACTKQLLLSECGGDEHRTPAARAIGVRTWATAYGRSNFEINLASSSYNGVGEIGAKLNSYLLIRGPLALSAQHPIVPEDALTVSAAVPGIDHILLMNNDGAGNLNFQVNFKDHPEAYMRLSVSSLAAAPSYQQTVEQNIGLMRALKPSNTAVATQEDLK